jgi:hypothetical protein
VAPRGGIVTQALPDTQQFVEKIKGRAVADNPRRLAISHVDLAFKIWQPLHHSSFDRVGLKLRIEILERVLGSAGFSNNIRQTNGSRPGVAVAAAFGVTLAPGEVVPWAGKLATMLTSVSKARRDLGT